MTFTYPLWYVIGGPCLLPAVFFSHQDAYEYAWKMNMPARSGSESACGYTYRVSQR